MMLKLRLWLLIALGALGCWRLIPQSCISLALTEELRLLIPRKTPNHSPVLRSSQLLMQCLRLFGGRDHTQFYLPVRIGEESLSRSEWIELLSQYTRTYPSDFMAKKELAESLLESGAEIEALAAYQNLMTHGWAVYAIGSRAVQTGQLERARAYFSLAVSISPDMINAWYQLGETQYHLGDPAAMQSYSRILDLSGSSELKSFSHVRIGSLLASHDPIKAKEHFLFALELHPKSWQAKEQLGRLSLAQGNYADACYWYLLANKESPDSQWVQRLLVDIEKVFKCESKV